MKKIATSVSIVFTRYKFYLQIERIQNLALFQQYKVKQLEVEKLNAKRTYNEKILFHGTSSVCVESIIQNGFNRSFCGENGM